MSTSAIHASQDVTIPVPLVTQPVVMLVVLDITWMMMTDVLFVIHHVLNVTNQIVGTVLNVHLVTTLVTVHAVLVTIPAMDVTQLEILVVMHVLQVIMLMLTLIAKHVMILVMAVPPLEILVVIHVLMIIMKMPTVIANYVMLLVINVLIQLPVIVSLVPKVTSKILLMI